VKQRRQKIKAHNLMSINPLGSTVIFMLIITATTFKILLLHIRCGRAVFPQKTIVFLLSLSLSLFLRLITHNINVLYYTFTVTVPIVYTHIVHVCV